MNSIAVSVYCGALVVLWCKFLAAIVIQARERFRQHTFRYGEDARCWRGEVAPDTDLCSRAQSLLRNSTESEPYFLVLGGVYLLRNAWPAGAPLYFGVYVISRVVHACYLLRAKQPHRTIAFSFGVIVCTLLAIHVAVAAFEALGSVPSSI